MAGRKRRVPSSAVGAVVTHDVYDEHDGYDPLNPSVGNVASVVKVTERKYVGNQLAEDKDAFDH